MELLPRHNFTPSCFCHLENTDLLNYADLPNLQWKMLLFVHKKTKSGKGDNILALVVIV